MSIDLDLAELSTRIEERVTVDDLPASVALRTAIGVWTDDAGVARPGMIHARHLPNEARRPSFPFIAYRGSTVLLTDGTVQSPMFRLFLYDAPASGYWRINKLVPLVSRAYSAEPIQVPFAVVGPMEIVDVSNEGDDSGLGMLMRYLTLAAKALT